MVKNITMKNSEIYTIANDILGAFQEEISLPVKINFYLQKNKNAIVQMAQEIEQERMNVFNKYGKLVEGEDGQQQYQFENEVVDEANKELTDLFDLEQEVKTYILNIEDFGDVVLTTTQMNAISYMFDEEE